ncbi:hypothetical protein GW17_00051824 [Ensete ventricosum]|nr:hypothetical protein GW17_00051824 [Ensete ventricosum]RZS17367.1 hypothetical protein BHM03_00049501 [Ensete ventricosum]
MILACELLSASWGKSSVIAGRSKRHFFSPRGLCRAHELLAKVSRGDFLSPHGLLGEKKHLSTWGEETSRAKGRRNEATQERDHVVPWVLHSDGVDPFCMVPKIKGALRHIYFILEKYLTDRLSNAKANSVDSSIPCSYRGRALIAKGTEKVENAEANSKYYDKTKG